MFQRFKITTFLTIATLMSSIYNLSAHATSNCTSGSMSVSDYCYIQNGTNQYTAVWMVQNNSSSTCTPSPGGSVSPMTSFSAYHSNFATLGAFTPGQTKYACAKTWDGSSNVVFSIDNKNKTMNHSNTSACTSTQLSNLAATCNATTLPVTLSAFEAQSNQNGVALTWVTESEINNQGFDVERSTDGENFESIHFESSQATEGNSVNKLTYHYEDQNPTESATLYYRLKQIDIDQVATYSELVSEQFNPGASVSISNAYPNPSSSQVSFKVLSPIPGVLTIFDLLGRTVLTQEIQDAMFAPLTLSIAKLPVGTYQANFQMSDGTTQLRKFIKTK